MSDDRIYLDYAASAPLSVAAKESIISTLDWVGNASSVHTSGRAARKLIEQAREEVADLIKARPSEILFTAGGTESNNDALKGLFWAQKSQDQRRNRIIVSTIEHHSVLDVVEWLKEYEKAQVTLVECDAQGTVTVESLRAALGEDPTDVAVISVMLANNEIGTINDIASLSTLAAECGAYFHCDAVSAAGHYPIDFSTLNIATMSLSAHKFGGPQGTGILVASRQASLVPLLHGGGQERDIRSGTYNTVGIVGLAAALKDSLHNLDQKNSHIWEIRRQIITSIQERIPQTYVHGMATSVNEPGAQYQMPGILNMRFPGCEGDSLLMLLDANGIECSHGAACSAGVASASHVLLALGLDELNARSGLRLSFADTLTEHHITRIVKVFPEVISRARLAGMANS